MKQKVQTRIVSVFMAIFLLINVIPMQVVAAEIPVSDKELLQAVDLRLLDGESSEVSESTENETANIVTEITEKRDKFQKEYLLSNGQHLLTIYPVAAHYQEDGEWKEIDNTLKAGILGGKKVYQNTDGLWKVSLPQTLTTDSPIILERDNSKLEFTFVGQLVSDTAAEGIRDYTQEIVGHSSTLDMLDANDTSTELTTEGNGDIELPDVTEENLVENDGITEQNDVIPETEAAFNTNDATNFSDSNTIDTPEEIIAPTESSLLIGNQIKIDETVFNIEKIREIQGVVSNKPVSMDDANRTLQESFAEKLNSEISYKDINEGIDLKYDLNSNMLKESVIIKDKPTAQIGYQYLLKANNLVLKLTDENIIYAYAKDDRLRENPEFVMPAPYLYDQDMGYCDDIKLVLEENSDGYSLTYLLPQDWLGSDDRTYPVVLDPVVEAELSFTNIADQTVFSNAYLSYTWAMLCIGKGSYGIGRSFLKYNNLPTLTSADVIVKATMNMYKLESSSSSSQINVHKVNNTWESNTITWSNKPGYNPIAEDFQYAGTAGWYSWDVTDIAQEWYSTGDNTGMMFKMEDATEAATTNTYREFCSSDYSAGTLPFLAIAYINNCGLENYWDYTTQNVPVAGTGYINNFTGNLVWVNPGLGFAGNRMPVAINHIYNANDKSSNTFGLGYGWRTNYNQQVYQFSADSSYYIWEDEDGTRHYFKYKSYGTYEDELGSGLILSTTGSGTSKYTLTDKDGNVSKFDTYGRLRQIINNQNTPSSITITYTTTSGKMISTITDGAGRVYRFTYSGSLLSKIAFCGTGTSEITSVSYAYSSSNLTTVTYPNSAAYFNYSLYHLLSAASNSEGMEIDYEYNIYSTSQPNRVSYVAVYDGVSIGGWQNIEYAHNQTKFTDHNGNCEILQFNNWGNTISVQDGEGHAQFNLYSQDNVQDSQVDYKKVNQMILGSKMQNTVSNQTRNSSFESTGYWTASSGTTSSKWNYSSAYSYMGQRSLYLSGDTSASVYSVQPTSNSYYTVYPGKTYTLSAYVKTTGNAVATGAQIALGLSGSSNFVATSDDITSSSNWIRLEATYTHPSTASTATIIPYLRNGSNGTAYFDCVQFEESTSASRYNLIENGDFIYAGSVSTDSYGWSEGDGCGNTENRTTYYSAAAPQLDNHVYAVNGTANIAKRCYQNLTISGNTGDVYTLAGWAKGDSVPLNSDSRKFALVCRFYNSDGTETNKYVNFNPDANSDIEWQYAAGRVVAEKNYTSIRILIVYESNENDVYFDGIQLFKEEFGHSYVYDADGNVISVTDLQNQTTTYQYSNNNLTRMMLPTGASQTYTYDTYHNVLTATSPEGVKSTFTYDAYGNNTSVSVGTTPKTTATATYTSNGNLLSSVTDALGNTTTYGYDTQTGVLNWVQAPGETAATRTNYTYDNSYRTTDVSKEDSAVAYDYSGTLLSAITSASDTEYTFTYGLFDLVSSVKVGNHTLISHTYSNDANRWLMRSDYGNGDYITYSYDNLGRVTGIGYEDNADAISYVYNNDGNLGILEDNLANRTTKYYYDFQGRLMRYDETGIGYSNSVQWGYDDENNLSSESQTLNGTTYTTNYTYDDDNRLTRSKQGSISSNYTYDSLSRVTAIAQRRSISNVVSTSIGYKNPSSGATSSQVQTWANTAGGNTTTYTYAYDNRGNITSISDGSHTTSYVYDGLDQLIRENNQAAGKTWVYTYDDGGNILTKKEYAYTTGTLGTVLDTISYGYGDTSWHDLLTSYDGQTLTIDAIGNLTNDGAWNYTWQHGRQLSRMSHSGDYTETLDYTYNESGQRIEKAYEKVYYELTGSGTQYYMVRYPVTTEYAYVGDTLTDVTVQEESNTAELHFTYDTIGPASVTFNGTAYYYLRNAQGDVTGIVNASDTQVVSYTYDAWGNPLSTTGSMADTLGLYNPLRYRGYVYDTETGLYYLQSRYYNPQTGRFINADGELAGVGEGIHGYNLFEYCNNNPITMSDSDGNWPTWAKKIVAAAAIVIAVTVVAAVIVATAGAGSPMACIAVGAAKGALAGFVSGAVTGAVTSVVTNRAKTGSWSGSGKAALNGAGDGALSGTVTGAVTGGMTSNVCFVAGTAVATTTGLVAIETIKAGDEVWSEDPDTGAKELKKVVRTFVNEADELIHVTVDGQSIDCTTEHPFYSPVKGWVAAIQLRAGDILVTVNGDYVVVEQVQHEILETPVQVFNFEVADYHTYFVGTSTVLAHNACGQRGVGGKGWVGDKTWRSNVDAVSKGGTIPSVNGGVPTANEATQLIEQAGGTVLRIDNAHLPPNPHTFPHINYLTKTGVKGTIKIFK